MATTEGQPNEPLKAADGAQADRLHRFAHDLRNRLAGLNEVFRMLPADDAAQEAELRSFFEGQFFQALRTVESLLDDLGVERGTGTLTSSPCAADALVRQAVADQQYRFDRKSQTLTRKVADDLNVLADPDHTVRALQALLSNASKFSPSGAAIVISADRHGDRARFTVTDPGEGLSAEDLDQVFVRYAVLGSRSTAGEAQGRSTLSRVRQWATAMEGTLIATSDGPGKGSSFVLELPLA